MKFRLQRRRGVELIETIITIVVVIFFFYLSVAVTTSTPVVRNNRTKTVEKTNKTVFLRVRTTATAAAATNVFPRDEDARRGFRGHNGTRTTVIVQSPYNTATTLPFFYYYTTGEWYLGAIIYFSSRHGAAD